MKLSILTPTLNQRIDSFLELKQELWSQIVENGAEEIIDIKKMSDNGVDSIGYKRNQLLQNSNAEYSVFFDDDDMPSSNYIKNILKALESKPDCCSLMGIITWDGKDGEIFEHSLRYKEYKTNPPTAGIRYERYPNHLNVIKTEIGQQFRFLEVNHGEDTDWATQLFKSGLLKTESVITDVIYHYKFKTNK